MCMLVQPSVREPRLDTFFWLARDDDPLVFALRERASRLTGLAPWSAFAAAL